MTRFVFGCYVEADLREIRDHIAKQNPEAARLMMVRFLSAFRLLAKHPSLGHSREDLAKADINFWPVGTYLILYVAHRRPIEILAVVHGARDIPSILNRRGH